MSLEQKLMDDLKTAMLAKDELHVATIRLLRAAIKYSSIEKGRALSDDEVLAVVAKEAKQRRDSITEYAKGGRQDLVDREKAELDVLQEYLPQQLGADEVTELARQAIVQVGAHSVADMSKVMAQLMPQVRGRADGRLVSDVVRGLLSQPA